MWSGDVIEYRGHTFINIDGAITHPVTGKFYALDGQPDERWRKQILICYLLELGRRDLENRKV